MWHGTKKVQKHWLLQYFRLSDILTTICSFNFNISQQKNKTKQTHGSLDSPGVMKLYSGFSLTSWCCSLFLLASRLLPAFVRVH